MADLVPLTVIILAKNEEALIERALASVNFAAERMVVDSGSQDATTALAAAAGALVVRQDWLGWPAQRNQGASLAAHDWVFFLEADEIVTPRLRSSIVETLSAEPDPRDGFSVDRRGDFLGVLLANDARPAKQASFVRLYNRRHSRWDDAALVHEQVLVPGHRHPLVGVLLHWRGHQLNEYVPSIDRYAQQEAQQLAAQGKHARARDLILRPVLRFGWLYFLRGDWRLGSRGLIHALLRAFSDFLRYARLWEAQHQSQRVVDPPADVWRQTS